MKDFKGKKGKRSQLIVGVGGQILYHLPVRAGLLTPCDLFFRCYLFTLSAHKITEGEVGEVI